MTGEANDPDAAELDELEADIDARKGELAELSQRLDKVLAKLPPKSKHVRRAHRLVGVVRNRQKLPDEALTWLSTAKATAEAASPPDYDELAKIGRETAVVHAWRGDDRAAAAALLPALAYACLMGDREQTGKIIAEFGRIELEARRFANVALVLRLLAERIAPEAPLNLRLPDVDANRARISLCQALNRIGAYGEALQQAETLLATLPPRPARLPFLTRLEQARALAGLKRFADAESALREAETLLPAKEEAYERSEYLQAKMELDELKGGPPAVESLQALIGEYSDQNLYGKEAVARRALANALFKLGKADEARDALADGLRRAVKARLDDVVEEIRADMLKAAGAEHLEEVAKAIDLIGGASSVERRFVRLNRLGKGGAGDVSRAVDLANGQQVALKKLELKAYDEDKRQAIIKTIKTEFAATLKLGDDHRFAKVIDLLMVPAGPIFIVQKYIQGPTLRELYESGVPPAALLGLLADIADALRFLHGQGVVHRDLKPENVIVARDEDSEDHPVLIDLGIALVAGRADGLERYGTPPYVAPEQVQGGLVDGRADIYALGQMIAEIWGGKVPSRLTLGLLRRADEPTLMPKAIREIVRGMLKEHPKDRLVDLKTIADALRTERQLPVMQQARPQA